MRSSMRSTSGRWPLKCCHSTSASAFGVPAFVVAVGVKHGDQVVEFAAAQRIVHEVRARAGPQDHVRPPEVVRHLVLLEHGAVGDVARDARLAVADDLVADLRPHAVAADQRAAPHAFAGLQDRGDAVGVLLEALDGAAASPASRRLSLRQALRIAAWMSARWVTA